MTAIARSQPRALGLAGSLFGLLALIAALLPTWVLPAVLPAKPLDQIVVETGRTIKEHLTARAKGLIYHKTEPKTALESWSQAFSIAALSLGVLAIAFAVFSLWRREEKLPAAAGAALGIGAIVAQVTLLLIGAVIVILIVYAVLDHIVFF
jgi:hypothetical protein